MKKLMIAAAAAAMVGGAFATEWVYDFTANVKTTGAKYGSAKTTYTVKVGQNTEGVYWWDTANGGASGLDGEVFTSNAEAKKYVSKLSNDEKMEFAEENLGYVKATGYCEFWVPEYYKSKTQPCYTFKFTETVGNCYRVATSKKLTDTIYVVEDCCDPEGWEFEDETPIKYDLFYRFGGASLAKATKVEVYAEWDRDETEEFTVAGQGVWSDKLMKVNSVYVKGVKNISGSIVGAILNEGCKDCCEYPEDAICFACECGYPTLDSWIQVNGADGEKEDTVTAAYGTWSIKFNSKKSFK